ncbi:MAG: galactokinase, partial [Planctomycetia bacterium]|nr:galactokinase [Planctomycetia bacterium]
SRLASELAEHWRRITGRSRDHHLGAAFSSTSVVQRILLENLRNHPEYDENQRLAWRNRLRHFEQESRICVPSAVAALRRGDLRRFGEIAEESQRAAEELLGNQVPETIQLVRLAKDLGAVASSAFGAGFGGSVWALVEESRKQAFSGEWLRRYTDAFPDHGERAAVYPVRAAPPAMILN